tara:strand:+ start:306 stop:554 length:249 start_codon:yes stop_codon:yes gene_type:complete
MKIFEVEFVYDDYDKKWSNDVGSTKNPFRVRMIYPRDIEYDAHYWSRNHRIMKDEFNNKHNPLINGSTYDRRYWVHAIRRVK